MRAGKWWWTVSIVGALALASTSIFLLSVGGRSLPLSPFCAERPTPDCLADHAFTLIEISSRGWKVDYVAERLARVGHFEQAERLVPAVRPVNSYDHARLYLLQRIAEQRVIQTARRLPDEPADGGPIENLAHIASLQDEPLLLVTLAYYLSALDLLGRRPDEISDAVLQADHAMPVAYPTIERHVARLETLIPTLPERLRSGGWIDLAVLRATLGDGRGALQALEKGLPTAILPYAAVETVLHVAPPSDVLAVLRRHGVERARDFLAAAKSMRRRGEALGAVEYTLRQAFDIAAKDQRNGPDLEQQRNVVLALLELGNHAAAAEYSLRALVQARTRPRLFPWIDLLTVAAMFIDRGDASSARQIVEEAVASFPANPSQLLGVGGVAGPVSFSNWGTGDRAHSAAAAQLHRLGDTVAFDRELAAVSAGYKLHAWLAIFEAPIPPGIAGPDLARAEADVGSGLRRFLLARVAAIRFSRDDFVGALLLTRRLIDEADRRPTPSDYEGLEDAARLALALNEPNLAAAALRRLVSAAICSGNPELLVKAAVFWATRLPSIGWQQGSIQ